MSIREDLLPIVNELRGLPSTFGLRRYAVTLRRRVWSGQYIGDGVPVVEDIVLTPMPKVRAQFAASTDNPRSLEYILANGNLIQDRFYKIDRITPRFVNNGVPGGFLPQQLRMKPPPDSKNIECIVALVGDDGVVRDCIQSSLATDRPFGYSMIVQETDRPRAALVSLAGPSSPSVKVGNTLALSATGQFEDGVSYDVTPLCLWFSSSPAVATVDVLGNVTGVSSGTTAVTFSLGSVTGSVSLTVL